MSDVSRAAEHIAQVERQVSEHIARTGPVLGRASSPDSAVTVVAPAGGAPQIQVSPAALRMGPQALGAEIVRVASVASRDAAAQLHRSLERIVDPASLSALGFEPGDPRW